MRILHHVLALLACGATTAAAAADLTTRPAAPVIPAPAAPMARSWISELRIGGSAQDPSGPESGSANLTGEILFAKPFTAPDFWTDVFVPRPHLGGSVNFSGRTSFAYAGLTWSLDITPQVFVEGSLGGAIHNGNTDSDPLLIRRDEAALGCSPLFRESASLGYRFAPRWSVMATIEHLSNAGLCEQNRGLTNIGVRLGYAF